MAEPWAGDPDHWPLTPVAFGKERGKEKASDSSDNLSEGVRRAPSLMARAKKVGQMKLRRLWLVLLCWSMWTNHVQRWGSSLVGHGMGCFKQRSGIALVMLLAEEEESRGLAGL